MVNNNGKEQKSVGKSGMAITSGCGDLSYFPYISIKQSAKVLPTFVAALDHPVQESFSSEDLDEIQSELEILLSKVALRLKILQTDYDLLDKDEKRFEKRGKHAEKNSLSGKRKREEKKTKTTVLKYPNLKSNQYYLGHYQKSSLSDGSDYLSQQQLRQQKIMVPKNDILNKFWLSVEPFCMPITNEDLRLLDDLLDQYSSNTVPPIPSLGKNSNNAYPVENMKSLNIAPHFSFSNSNVKDTQALQKPTSNVYPTGILTQHVVSALMETEDFKIDITNSCENYNNSEINCYKPFEMKNEIAVEKSIRKELIAQGLLENEFSEDEDDEILDEIKRLSADLSATSAYNQQALRKLREICAHEIARFHCKSNLDSVDTEILETYKNFTLPKSKPKLLNAQEQRTILRLTSEQKAWTDKLEENNLNFTM